jgi:hypothetical protein
VQIPEDSGDGFYDLLRSRDIRPVAHIPDGWLSVSAPDDVDWSGLGILRAEILSAADKISPELFGFENGYLVVEFHADTGRGEMRVIASRAGFEIVENPDVAPSQILVRGSREQIELLARWDEVAYVFPASGELAERRPVVACLGPQVGDLSVGQYVERVGEGWDGPGRNSTTLGYYYLSGTAMLPAGFIQAEFERALSEWAQYVDVQFVRSVSPLSSRTLTVLFGTRSHGDPFPFDGPGRVLAHTFYPAPPNPEPVAGDVHFDEDENWGLPGGLDFYSVALHEVGHALGLGHSDRPGAVMYAYYRRADGLAAEDVTAIQQLYAPRASSHAPAPLAISMTSRVSGSVAVLDGTVTGGSGDVAVTWTNSRGGSGTAQGGRSWTVSVSLHPGVNALTFRAVDSAGAEVARSITLQTSSKTSASLNLQVTSPSVSGVYRTDSNAIVLSGTSAGAVRVSWVSSRGASGNAAGAASWTSGSIPLLPGTNVLTVTAHSPEGSKISRSIEILCGGHDSSGPGIQIQSPISTTVATSASSIVFRGTAWDSGGVVEVTWTSSNAFSGTASGTTSWTTKPIPLLVGINHITIRARDTAGNSSWRSVTVTRRE